METGMKKILPYLVLWMTRLVWIGALGFLPAYFLYDFYRAGLLAEVLISMLLLAASFFTPLFLWSAADWAKKKIKEEKPK